MVLEGGFLGRRWLRRLLGRRCSLRVKIEALKLLGMSHGELGRSWGRSCRWGDVLEKKLCGGGNGCDGGGGGGNGGGGGGDGCDGGGGGGNGGGGGGEIGGDEVSGGGELGVDEVSGGMEGRMFC